MTKNDFAKRLFKQVLKLHPDFIHIEVQKNVLTLEVV